VATFSLEIPDAQVERVTEALAAFYGYQAELEDGTPNPELAVEFNRRMVAHELHLKVRAYEMEQAAAAARAAAAAAVDAEVTIL